MSSTVIHDDKFILLHHHHRHFIAKLCEIGEQYKHLLLLKFPQKTTVSQKLELDRHHYSPERRRKNRSRRRRKENAQALQSHQSHCDFTTRTVNSNSHPDPPSPPPQSTQTEKNENETGCGGERLRLAGDYNSNYNDCDCDFKSNCNCNYNCDCDKSDEWRNSTLKKERRRKNERHHHLKLLHIFVILMISFIPETCSTASAFSPLFSFSPSIASRTTSSYSNIDGGRPYMNLPNNNNNNNINRSNRISSGIMNGNQPTVNCTREKSNQHLTNPNYMTAGTIRCRLVLNPLQFKNSTITISLSRQIIKEMSKNLSFRSSPRSPVIALEVQCQPHRLATNPNSTSTVEHEMKTVFDFSELSRELPKLQSIAIIGCKLSDDGLIGTLPRSLRRLDLSNNSLESLSEKLFSSPSSSSSSSSSNSNSSGKTKWVLASVNLTGNADLQSLPASLLNMTSVTEVWINRHNMSCPWVATHLYHWHERNIIRDSDKSKSLCRSNSSENSVPLTLYGALRAKQDETEECKKVDASCSCSIYTVQFTHTLQPSNFPVSFQINEQNVSVTLKIDCSFRGLKKLPKISPLTKVLNVSHNQIKNLNELRSPEYRNLGTLDAEFNHIESIDSVEGASFLGHFDALGLRHNNITSLTHHLMSILLDREVKGHGRIRLGENYINCDCDTAKFLKPLLAEHQKRIADAKRLFCRNVEPPIKVQDLDLQKVCELEDGNEQNAKWIIIITVEVLLILVILMKVGWDSRQYRETGILPCLSSHMPRLPCDFMLEGIKEGPNGR